MKVFDLRCAHDHRFEGWFASGAAFDAQLARDLVACPVCGDTAVARLPSAPHLNLSGARAGAAAPASGAAAAAALRARWLGAMREVARRTEDVGAAFADEARRIHYQEAPARAIRGTASRQQAAELVDEGIEIVALPMPVLPKETLQ